MSARAAYLLAHLNARVAPFEILPNSYESFTTADVAHALGLVRSAGARALMRVKWAQQDAAMPILLRETAATALDALERYPCSAPDPYRLTAVISVAIQETIKPRVCKTCSGTGIYYQLELSETDKNQSQQWVRKQCWACDGEGHRPYSERSRCRQARMDRDAWRREWARPYADVLLPILDRWDQLGLRAINRRLHR